jgi:ArsR family transcriptional regulator, arsenate/arsenite/antimonite-responsive transcriptional repressor
MMDSTTQLTQLEITSVKRSCDPTVELRVQKDEAEAFAMMFKALSHPVRVQILDLISQGKGETCACDIERHFELTQPTISHHLKVLRDAGLITSESRGVWVHHRVNRAKVTALRYLLATMQNNSE